MSDPTLATTTKIPAERFGGPGSPVAELCSAAAISALSEAAGPDMRLTSLALDVASHALGEGVVEVATKVDKRAKSIVFVSTEARMGSSLAFSAQGLFSKVR